MGAQALAISSCQTLAFSSEPFCFLWFQTMEKHVDGIPMFFHRLTHLDSTRPGDSQHCTSLLQCPSPETWRIQLLRKCFPPAR